MLEVILAGQLADLSPKYRHLVAKSGNFTLLLLELIMGDQQADLVAKSGSFRFLLLDLILTDQLADLHPTQ